MFLIIIHRKRLFINFLYQKYSKSKFVSNFSMLAIVFLPKLIIHIIIIHINICTNAYSHFYLFNCICHRKANSISLNRRKRFFAGFAIIHIHIYKYVCLTVLSVAYSKTLLHMLSFWYLQPALWNSLSTLPCDSWWCAIVLIFITEIFKLKPFLFQRSK